jgi:membrane-associated phospholipid phosphatase
MSQDLNSIEHFIIGLRSEELTFFFNIFRIFANPYFYILCIALTYWLRPTWRFSRELVFVIPYATLINATIKNIFRIPRPQIVQHLIATYDPFGFPSGDAQITTVFWGMIFISIKSHKWRYLCLLPIFGAAVSRIYFGVHRLNEVLAGIAIGVLIILLWNAVLKKIVWQREFLGRYTFFVVVFMGLYITVSQGVSMVPLLAVCGGTFAGIAFCWRSIHAQNSQPLPLLPAISLLLIILGLMMLIPAAPTHASEQSVIAIKFFIIILSIFKLIPSIVGKSSS